MTSNRMFYIGLGCILSTLFWTLTAAVVSDPPIYPDKDKKETLEVDRIVCKEINVLDSNGKVGIRIYDHHYGEGGGNTLLMSFKDNRIFSNGLVSEGELVIHDRGLTIFNAMGDDVLSAHLERYNGFFSAKRYDGSNKFLIDTDNTKYSKTHCPCRLVK